VQQAQEHLRCRLLLENPSSYFEFDGSSLAEAQFLSEVVARTGCGLLLDVNNAHVACSNRGGDALAYLRRAAAAGRRRDPSGGLRARQRCRRRGPADRRPRQRRRRRRVVLYRHVLARTGPVATLLEWDNQVPDWPELRDEALKAQRLLAQCQPAEQEICT
jgi:uncharacterized protein (UPF0276 family)